MQNTPIDVYVPVEGALALATVDPHSGIVGSGAQGWLDSAEQNDLHRIVLDFEGNRFQAANIVTFADRVSHAADRHKAHYPTVARIVVDVDQVRRAGTFYPQWRRVEVDDAGELLAIAKWLGMFDGEQFDADRLHAELRCGDGLVRA